MLPFPEHPQNILDKSFAEQLDLNPHLLLNSSSYFVPSTPAILGPEGFCDILFPSDGITNALPWPTRPCRPLSDDSAPPLMERRYIDDNTSSIRKRSTRKDRHSKIFTANGPRDRRMRLSIDVAQKFFQLQDILGFDKASKTVQWLLTMSKAAIKELATTSSFKICTSGNQSPKSESSTLMCEDSSTLPVSKNRSSAAVTAVASCEVKKAKANKGAIKPSRKTEFHSALARESRARARERARERTREKQRMTSLSSSIPSDAIKEESNLHNLSSLLEFADEEEGKPCAPNQCLDIASERAYEYPMIGGSVLIPIFDKNQIATAITDTGSIFQEQWDMEAISFYSR